MWTFEPILKATIWGGEKIKEFKNISADMENIGESWELSGVEGNESVVSAGPDKGETLSALIEKYKENLMGKENYHRFGNRFPLLIKFIDAREDLSVQVHPDDILAERRGMPNGKTEMWYVVGSRYGARLANGFINKIDKENYENLVKSGDFENVLNFMKIKPGDVYFIPAGRVHAIGAGAFVAEIQQTSDATYRIYDYHRKDKQGNERELHTELAKDAIDFNDDNGRPVEYCGKENTAVNVVDTPFFTTDVLNFDKETVIDYSGIDSFVVVIATEGIATLRCEGESVRIPQGTTALIPASARQLTITPEGQFTALQTYIR